jgi:hypothetical protein
VLYGPSTAFSSKSHEPALIHSQDWAISLSKSDPLIISPHQSRIIPLTFTQKRRLLPETRLNFALVLRQFDPQTGESGRFIELPISVPITHRSLWGSDSSSSLAAFRTTGSQGGVPFVFMVKPPYHPNPRAPVVVALRE